MHDFIDHLPDDLLHEDGVQDLNVPVDVLKKYGAIFERDGPPLTFKVDSPTPRREQIQVFVPSDLKIGIVVDDYTDKSKEYTETR